MASVLRAFTAGGGGGLCVSHDEALLGAVCARRILTADLSPEEPLEPAVLRDAGVP